MDKKIDSKKIGNFTPESPFFLAPMAGFTDLSYRTICGKMGAALTYTEMVSAKGLYYGDRKSPKLLEIGTEEKPVGFQLFGRDPDIMAWAVEKLEDHNNVLIDVNMGCPVPKVVKNGEGSALLREPELIYKIIKKMSGATYKPITVKMRIGIEGASENGFLDAAKAMSEGGASAIAVHGRTREQYYSGKADRIAIKKVKESVSIPVIGNGDIAGLHDAVSMMEETGCDFVMIGRAAVGDPWIFRRLSQGLDQNFDNGDSDMDIEQKVQMMLTHYKALEENKGEYTAVREMRKFVSKYLKGVPGSLVIRGQINSIDNGSDFCKALERLISE